MSAFDPVQYEQTTESAQELTQFDGPNGFEGPCEMVVGVGRK